ncbi:hypothetical protein DPMN_104392 [Dreissena polymorpha]|uniref:Serine-threonine/tyrosine-protein kinase catalytic domain-containing protein n=1 Tax=Dreissena polymorpha TaxID=45954 RepID=A0A9D4H9V7_DREPO|nr:hypothetical protein DPMN_104392 [Dreissena polymorpha]
MHYVQFSQNTTHFFPEIVKQLIERRDGVFRPTSSPETECPFELRMLMEQCWCEDPDLRPNFSIIDHKFRKIRAYVK